MTNPRNPNHIDQHIGRFLRQLRKSASMTQTELADSLGVTFQQVQKYERGTNRISASRLYAICQVFEKTPNDFFDMQEEEKSKAA